VPYSQRSTKEFPAIPGFDRNLVVVNFNSWGGPIQGLGFDASPAASHDFETLVHSTVEPLEELPEAQLRSGRGERI
jgi:hypothetical protein